MRQLSILLFLVITSMTISASANQPLVVCKATGHSLRQNGVDSKELLAESKFKFRLGLSQRKVYTNYKGFVAVQYVFSTEANKNRVDPTKPHYRGTFVGKNKMASMKNPRASKYKDSLYLRFKDFDAAKTNDEDGGGMFGYLVISKKAFVQNSQRYFDAHYVFQAGDHMGGSIDYTCRREN